MSHEERYGTIVWNALSEVFNLEKTGDEAWITVGEVASHAKITKPTAVKYLNKLVDMGHAKRITVGSGKSMLKAFRPAWGFNNVFE